MRVLMLPCHSILEYDELRLFHSLGHEVASLGAYIDPAHPHDVTRPPLPDVPMVEIVKREVDALGQQGHWDTLAAAKEHIPDAILDWAEVIICSGQEHAWIAPQWQHIKHKRVIWRTIGQSAHPNEWMMKPLHKQGMEIVRYSPKERNIPEYAGENALIRFYKDPNDWNGWTGDDPVVTNITQNLYRRSLHDYGSLQIRGSQWTSYQFWAEATEGLPTKPAGPGSDEWGGLGMLTPDEQLALLRSSRAYVATGTQPASYVLNFIEALMTGIPTVSIGPDWMCILPYGHLMLEMHELAPLWANDPAEARKVLAELLLDHDYAKEVSAKQRAFAIETFGMETIKAQWAAYLQGAMVPELVAV